MQEQEREYIYENAPVTEVVAEVHWQLKSILGSGLHYDPFYEDLIDSFSGNIAQKGFPFREQLIQEGVPTEFLSFKATHRFRNKRDGWPLYQIGPGVFTANITPPYGGWNSFFSVLSEGLSVLFESYPLSSKHLKPKLLKLIYINAFEEKHGYTNQRDFLDEGLNFQIGMPTELDRFADINSIAITSEFNFKLTNLENSFAKVKVGPGSNDGKPALVVENILYRSVEELDVVCDDILHWFQDARNSNHGIFEGYITEKTRESFGKKNQLNNG